MRGTLYAALFFVVAFPLVAQVTDHTNQQPIADQFPYDPGKLPAIILEESLDGTLGAAPANMVPQPLLPLALDLIKHFESWVPTLYNDSALLCTIGYGHLVPPKGACNAVHRAKYPTALPPAEGIALLNGDTGLARLAVQQYVTVDLNDEQFGALASFVFNLGEGNFLSSKLLRLLNQGEYDLAAQQFGRWVKAKDPRTHVLTVQNGLVIRRACEATLFKGDLRYNARGEFDRALCETLGIAPEAGPLIDINVGEGPARQ